MPPKYMIHTKPVPHRFKAITKSGVIAWEEGCLKCAVCVKKQCVYGVYDNRDLDTHQMIDSIDNQCMNCFRCVQNCPKELIHKSKTPEYQSLGDAYWTPDIISKLWYQAETGKIPVSGAGYPGPFSGSGFDSMWTDMSEIVRPTRDGIHGREYISTAIDLGKTPGHLSFSDQGELTGDVPEVIDIPLPIIMRVPHFGSLSGRTIEGWAMAAAKLGTFLALPEEMILEDRPDLQPCLLPVIKEGPRSLDPEPPGARLYEIPWQKDWGKRTDRIKKHQPSALISVRLPLREGVEKRALSLVESGVSIIHLEGSEDGRAQDNESLTIKDGIRSVHGALLEGNVRDGITLLASGGVAMAENVAKSLLCGADGVIIDIPLLIALECRVCGRCKKDLSCPVEIERASSDWVSHRTVNLMGAWHNQLLEMMGAMGIRDARRLRGETGRAMFFEDLDRATFESMGSLEEGLEIE